jgi:hypothetical protein
LLQLHSVCAKRSDGLLHRARRRPPASAQPAMTRMSVDMRSRGAAEHGAEHGVARHRARGEGAAEADESGGLLGVIKQKVSVQPDNGVSGSRVMADFVKVRKA